MFQPNEISAYREIKAPDSLRERVLGSTEKTGKRVIRFPVRKQYQRFGAMAACLALLLSLSVFTAAPWKSTPIVLNGQELGKSPVPVMETGGANVPALAAWRRETEILSLPLEIEFEQMAEIIPSFGSVRVTSRESGEETEPEGNVVLTWEIGRPDTDQTYTLTLLEGNSSRVVTLVFDQAAGEWTVCCDYQ